MNDRPTAPELLEAVERFLREDAIPALSGHTKYQARVAANVVAIVARELGSEEDQLAGEWKRLGELFGDDAEAPGRASALRVALTRRNEELVRRIRAGDADGGPWRADLIRHLKKTVADKLAVARPGGR